MVFSKGYIDWLIYRQKKEMSVLILGGERSHFSSGLSVSLSLDKIIKFVHDFFQLCFPFLKIQVLLNRRILSCELLNLAAVHLINQSIVNFARKLEKEFVQEFDLNKHDSLCSHIFLVTTAPRHPVDSRLTV